VLLDRIAFAAARIKRNLVCCLILIVSLLDSSVALAQPTLLQQSFDLQIPRRPMPAMIGGKRQLIYELHFTNFASTDLALKRIEIVDSAGVVLS
jgi:murein DD-endopeptidase